MDDKIYLIVSEIDVSGCINFLPKGSIDIFFTKDKNTVVERLKKANTRVFDLSSLPEIKSIDVQYTETLKD